MTNWGIEIRDTPDRFQMTIPPVGGVTALPSTYWVAVAGWLAFAGLIVATIVMAGPDKDGDVGGVIAPFAQVAVIGVIIFWMAWYRLHRQLTIDLSDHWLSLLNRDGEPTRRWRRADLIEIKANSINGKLVIRAQGQEMRELFIGPERDMAVFVADRLRAALGRPIPAATATPPAEPGPARPPAAPLSAGQLTIGMGLATIATITLIGLAFASPTLACVLIGGGVVAAVPVGIYLGTQKKDIWV